MSVSRQLNVISQMRLDVPHIRLIESGVAGDFDTVVGRGLAGGAGLILRGFTIAGAVNDLANTLHLVTADGIAVNLHASESGSFLWVPSTRASELLDGASNGRVLGAFVPSATNYVGLDFVRELDDSTIDLVKFKDPVTSAESDRLVPLGNVLNYKIVISTSPFSTQANIIPVAKVTVSSVGVVTAIADARQMMYRLGSGGDAPNSLSSYSWPAGRLEGAFTGADKSFTSQKEWSDAVMTRLWELGGGQNWFAPTADRNVHQINYGAPFANGDYMTFDSGSGAISWQGISFLFDGGTAGATANDVAAGSGIITDGQCLYVDLDRTQNRYDPGNPIFASITNLSTLGTGTTPGSRWVLAWRVSGSLFQRGWRYPVGTTFVPATASSMGVVMLHGTPASALTPKVVAIQANNKIVLSLGAAAGAGWGMAITATAGVTGFIASGGAGGSAGDGVQGVGGTAPINGDVPGVGGRFTGGYGDDGNLPGDGVVGTGGGGGLAGVGVRGVGVGGGVGVVGAGSLTAAGVTGTGGTSAGAQGVMGIGGSTSGVGVEGVGTAGNSGGVKGTGQGGGTGVAGYGGGTGLGVYGEGADGGGVFHSLGANAGVIGQNILGGGPGGYFQGDGAGAGLRAFGGTTSGKGVEAYGGAPNGIGVYGRGTGNGPGVQGSGQAATTGAGGDFTGGTAGGDGVRGIATTTGVGVKGTASSATEFGVQSATGHVGAPIASEFKFNAVKTGYIFVPVSEMQKVSGSAALTPSVAPLFISSYPITSANTARLIGSVRVPRGATLTNIDVHAYNGDSGGASYSCNTPAISSYDYDTGSTVMIKTVLLTGGVAFTITGSAVSPDRGFFFAGACAATPVNSGSTTIGNSGVIEIDWNIPNTIATGNTHIAGLLITYTYQTVDFMI